MVVQQKYISVDEFDQFVDLPENADKLFEYIAGEIVEVPSNPYSSYIASRINRRVAAFVEDNDLGYVTGEAGGYMIMGERYAPDVAFISKQRQPQLAKTGYNPNPPDLAIEVLSPPDDLKSKRWITKITNYLAAGVLLVIVYTDEREVGVYAPGQPAKTLTAKDTLDFGAVLPGFQMPVQAIFPAEANDEA